MKPFHILAIIFSMVISNFCGAEQEISVTPIKKIELEEVNFDNLPREAQVSNLSELVKDEEGFADAFSQKIKTPLILYPYSEGLAYVNGQLCHVGNYSRSVIYTVLEGPYYGTQMTLTYSGIVMHVNDYDYDMKYTNGGVIFHHYYPDSKVITGANQVIKFY